MIKLLGIRRLLTLTVMAAILVVLGAIYLLWISPSAADANTQVNMLDGEIAQLQTNISTTKEQIEETRDNLPFFRRLDAVGFFEEQDRFQAQRAIEEIRRESGIKSARFSIGVLQDINSPKAQEAGYRLVVSDIEVSQIESFTDMEFYNLIYLLNNRFPGHMRIVDMNVRRLTTIDTTNFDAAPAANAVPEHYAEGLANFQWITMIEETAELPDSLNGGVQ